MRSSVNAIKLLCAGLCLGSVAPAYAQVLETHGGVALDASAPDNMSCEELSATLAAIDQSGYRSNSGAPIHSEDVAIFNYETNVSEEFFWRCAAADDDAASRSGFSNLAHE